MSYIWRRGTIYWYKAYKNGASIRRSLKTSDRSEARYLQAKLDQELAERVSPLSTNISAEDAFHKYAADRDPYRTPGVNADYKTKILGFVHWSGAKTLKDITERSISAYINHLLETPRKVKLASGKVRTAPPVGECSCNNTITALKAWLKWCEVQNYIFKSPASGVVKFDVAENDARFASKEALDAILGAAKAPANASLYPMIFAALFTGMRKKELFFLNWEDVDLDHGVIRVRNKEDFRTKSKKNRLIPIHPRLQVVLAGIRKDSGRVFAITNQRRIMRRILKAAGIKKDAWHILRHSAASYMLMSGIDPVTVMKILGHSNMEITQRYAHILPAHFHKSIKKLKF
jgi:integrase